MRNKPLCEHCIAKGKVEMAVEIDHIVALVNGGADDETNMQCLCKECHRIKTAKDLGHVVRKKIGIDGWPEDF